MSDAENYEDTTLRNEAYDYEATVMESNGSLRHDYLLYIDCDDDTYNIITGLDDEYFLEYIKRTEKNENLIKTMQDYFTEYNDFSLKFGDAWLCLDQEKMNEIFMNTQYLLNKNHKIRQNLKLLRATRDIQEPEQAPETSIPKIIWKGKTADLARIYKDLLKAGLITTTGRDFSKHFIDKKGTDIPLDFTENLSTNQACFSPNQHVESLQLKIREMKPESGE